MLRKLKSNHSDGEKEALLVNEENTEISPAFSSPSSFSMKEALQPTSTTKVNSSFTPFIENDATTPHKKHGEGGHGEISISTLNGQKVAVKQAKNSMGKEQLKNELALLISLQACKEVIHLVGIQLSQNGENLLVFDFYPYNLWELILEKRDLPAGAKLNAKNAQSLIIDLLLAVAYCHDNGVIHHDIKPDNLLITADMQLKLADFGLAERCGSKPLFSTSIEGSSDYLAPEIISDIERACIPKTLLGHNEKIDIYSIGIVVLVLTLGKTHFHVLGFDNYPDPNMNMAMSSLILSKFLKAVEEGASPSFNEKIIDPTLIYFITQCRLVNPTQRPSAERLLIMMRTRSEKSKKEMFKHLEKDQPYDDSLFKLSR